MVSEKDKNGLLHIISSIQVSCQASEDVKNRRQQGFVDFLDVYLNYYAVAAKRSTYFFFLKKKKRSEFELCRKNTLDITFPLYIWVNVIAGTKRAIPLA